MSYEYYLDINFRKDHGVFSTDSQSKLIKNTHKKQNLGLIFHRSILNILKACLAFFFPGLPFFFWTLHDYSNITKEKVGDKTITEVNYFYPLQV